MTKILLLFLCSLFIGCTNSVNKQESIRTVKCDTVKIVPNPVEQSTFTGRVKAALEANISFRIAEQISRMNVVEGEFVRKGAIIAQLDDRDYQTQFSATQAEHNRIKSEADRIIELYKKQSATPNDYDKAVYGSKQISAKLEAHQNALNDTRLVAPKDIYDSIPAFYRYKEQHRLIHTPKSSEMGCQDANLAYQNASLTAQSFGVGQISGEESSPSKLLLY